MRKRAKAFQRRKSSQYKAAERVLEASRQPLSTDVVQRGDDVRMHAVDTREPNRGDVEQTIKDYSGRTDMEAQGGVPGELPDTNPMPLQHIRKPKGPPKYNL